MGLPVASTASLAPQRGVVNHASPAVSGGRGQRAGFLTKCATSRAALPVPELLEQNPSAAARRQRRLHRGIDRWALSHEWRKTRVHHSHLFTFTCTRKTDHDLWGEWQRVHEAIRHTFKRQQYFVWLEIQRDGTLHYHLAWLNAPWVEKETMAEWLQRVWGHGHVDQKFRGKARSLQGLVRYVRGEVKKQGSKAYQQDYAAVATGIRTFNSELKGFPPELLDAHLDSWESLYVDGRVQLTARIEHVHNDVCSPTPGQRDRAERQRRYRAGRRMALVWTNAKPDSPGGAHPLLRTSSSDQVSAAALAQLALAFLSEHAEWERRVRELPW